ncbi:MAG: patatin-like phospholipase family protein [Anaerolineae bacterium]
MKRIAHQSEKIEDSLQRIPFFSRLLPDMLTAIAAKLQHEHYYHGEVVFVEGSVGDSFYLIESGQVRISTGFGAEEKIIDYLGPGNFFGEMALLLDQRRSASVTVVIDADFWVLHKDDLDQLLEEYPVIALEISRELSRRLTGSLQRAVRKETYNLIAVAAQKPWQLAVRLTGLTHERIVVFDLTETNLVERVNEILPNEVVPLDAMPGLSGAELAESLGILVEAYDRVLLSISPERCKSSVKALQLAEVTVLIDVEQRPWMSDLASGPIWQVPNTPQVIDRTARRLAQRVVGLALSSGGARGMAHIGVLRVLEREGIPIDTLAGTSIGALIGGLYAAGYSIDNIDRFALHFQNKLKLRDGLLDLNLPPRSGLIRGRRLRNYLEQVFEGITFEELKIPFYVVATDVLSGEEVVFEKGSLADAVRASASIIGLFSPYHFNDRYLVDGGAVNPLPISVLAEKGADIILASRAIPSLEGERQGGQASRRWKSLNNILGIFLNYQSIMEREIIKTRLNPVDVLIHPHVEVYTAMDYHQAADFIRLGEEAAEQAMDEIKRKVFAARGERV